MRRAISVGLVMALLLSIPATVQAAPPARPLGVTPSQFDQLRQVEAQSEHVAVLDVRASYKSEHEKQLELTRASDDFWSGMMLIGYPGLIIGLLICAAPL